MYTLKYNIYPSSLEMWRQNGDTSLSSCIQHTLRELWSGFNATSQNIIGIETPEATILLQKFCPEKKEQIKHNQSRRPSLILRRAVVLALVRRHFMDTLPMTLEDALSIFIHREISGAPYLVLPKMEKPPTDLHISISHTGSWVAFVLSDLNNPTTIDVEDTQKPRAFRKITRSVFSEQEQGYVGQYGALGFYYLWGSKEALAKWHKQDLPFALGIDLSDQLCPPSQKTSCIIEYNSHRFVLTFLMEGAILTTTCTEQKSQQV